MKELGYCLAQSIFRRKEEKMKKKHTNQTTMALFNSYELGAEES